MRRQKVLHPTALSPDDESAFLHALKLAVVAGAELRMLHVDERPEEVAWSEFPHVRERLAMWKAIDSDGSDGELGPLQVRKAVVPGSRSLSRILAYVEEKEPEIIVLATHQRSGIIDRLTHPAVAEPLARRSRTMTLFVPSGAPGFVDAQTGESMLRTVLVPVASTPNPQYAIDAVSELLRLLEVAEAHLVVVHVGTTDTFPLVELPSRRGILSTRLLRKGDVVTCISTVAAEYDVDLVAMVTEGHTSLLDALRGDTTERVLRRVHCPVLAVPAW